MDLRRRSAAALAGLVLLVGGVAAGCSADATSTEQNQGAPGQGGPGRGFEFDTSALVTALAEEFGLDEAEVKTAVDDATSSLMGGRGERPEGTPSDFPSGAPSDMPSAPPSGMPEGGGGGQFAEQIAEAIASALGVDEQKVLTIVQDNLPTGGRNGPGGNGGGNR